MKGFGKKQILTKADKDELLVRLKNPRLPSLGRVLARRRRSLTEHLVNELGLTTREKGLAFVHSLAANPERLEFSYEADFLEAIEALPLTDSSDLDVAGPSDAPHTTLSTDSQSMESTTSSTVHEPSTAKKAKESENKRLKNTSEV